MIKMFTIKVTTNAPGHFVGSQSAGGFDNRSLTMYQPRLYGIEPGTLGRQPAWDNLYSVPTCSPPCQHRTVVLPQPFPHFPAYMPARIVPYHHQYPLDFSTQSLTSPLQVSDRNRAYRPPVNEAQHHLMRVVSQKAIATQRLGVFVFLAKAPLHQPQRLFLLTPTVHGRLFEPAPPYLVLKAHHPTFPGTLNCSLNQGVASFFFLTYSGSG